MSKIIEEIRKALEKNLCSEAELEYIEENSLAWLRTLLDEIERLTKERNDHGPEGRNYTNGQYVELLLKYEALLKENERLTKEYAEERAAHNSHVTELLQVEKERDDWERTAWAEIEENKQLHAANTAMREALDLAMPIVEHNSPTRAEMIHSILAKIGEGEKP